jgi:hypothetical protein
MTRETVTSENREEYIAKKMGNKSIPKVDNQGRDLAGTKKHLDLLAKMHESGSKEAQEHFERVKKDVPLPDWTEVNGVKVLRSGEASHIGVPSNGKESAAHYDVIHWPKKEFVLKLKKHEIHPWLHSMAKNEFEEKHGRSPGEKKK